MSTVIQVTDLSKIYRLGEIGTGTISRDLERWYKMRIRGQEDPFLKIGEANEQSKKGVSDVVYSLRDINFEAQQGEALGHYWQERRGQKHLVKNHLPCYQPHHRQNSNKMTLSYTDYIKRTV